MTFRFSMIGEGPDLFGSPWLGCLRRLLVALAVTAVAVAAPAPVQASTAPTPTSGAVVGVTGQPIDGLIQDVTTTYVVDPDAGAIRVRVEARLTNTFGNEVSGNVVRSFFFDRWVVPSIAGAVGVRATRLSDGVPLRVSSEEGNEFFDVVVVDLSPNLTNGSPQTIVVDYSFPRSAPRSGSIARLNSAFATLPLLAFGDPGMADIELRVPERFTVEFVGNLLDPDFPISGFSTWRLDDIASPGEFFSTPIARDDDSLITSTLDVPDTDILVLAWPDDQVWADFVSGTVEDGVPVIEELIGEPFPAPGGDLRIVENTAPYLYGYAGWYLPNEGLIEVGDDLDDQVVLHELTHLWFNDDHFEERWMAEGFADLISNRVLDELDRESRTPDEIDDEQLGAQPLNSWSVPRPTDDDAADIEGFGYNAAYSVMAGIRDEIGDEGIRRVLEAVYADEIAYAGDGAAEIVSHTTDWRRLLDLFEGVGGSENSRQIFSDHVARSTQLPMLVQRAVARGQYEEFVASSDGWSAPYPVRAAIAEWRFSVIDERIDSARGLLSRRDELVAELSVADLDLPSNLETMYETAPNLADVAAAISAATTAGGFVVDATRAVTGSHNPLQIIGLVRAKHEAHLLAAHTAYEAGDLETATLAARQARAVIDGANSAGVVRILLALAVFGVFGGLGFGLRRRGRGDGARAVPDEAADPALDRSAAGAAGEPVGEWTNDAGSPPS